MPPQMYTTKRKRERLSVGTYCSAPWTKLVLLALYQLDTSGAFPPLTFGDVYIFLLNRWVEGMLINRTLTQPNQPKQQSKFRKWWCNPPSVEKTHNMFSKVSKWKHLCVFSTLDGSTSLLYLAVASVYTCCGPSMKFIFFFFFFTSLGIVLG
jgi:hypothetical protein